MSFHTQRPSLPMHGGDQGSYGHDIHRKHRQQNQPQLDTRRGHYSSYQSGSSSPPRSSSPPGTPYTARHHTYGHGHAHIRSSPEITSEDTRIPYRGHSEHADDLPSPSVWDHRYPSNVKYNYATPTYASAYAYTRESSHPSTGFYPPTSDFDPSDYSEDVDVDMPDVDSEHTSDSGPGQSSGVYSESEEEAGRADDEREEESAGEAEEQEEEDFFSFGYAGRRRTFFRTSAERGQWKSNPIPFKSSTSSILQSRKSAPTLSRVPTPTLKTTTTTTNPSRTISEPAPSIVSGSESTFVPPAPLALRQDSPDHPNLPSSTSNIGPTLTTEESVIPTTTAAQEDEEAETLATLPSLTSDRESSVGDVDADYADDEDVDVRMLSSSLPPSSPPPPMSPAMSFAVSRMSRSISPLPFGDDLVGDRSSSPLSELPDDDDEDIDEKEEQTNLTLSTSTSRVGPRENEVPPSSSSSDPVLLPPLKAKSKSPSPSPSPAISAEQTERIPEHRSTSLDSPSTSKPIPSITESLVSVPTPTPLPLPLPTHISGSEKKDNQPVVCSNVGPNAEGGGLKEEGKKQKRRKKEREQGSEEPVKKKRKTLGGEVAVNKNKSVDAEKENGKERLVVKPKERVKVKAVKGKQDVEMRGLDEEVEVDVMMDMDMGADEKMKSKTTKVKAKKVLEGVDKRAVSEAQDVVKKKKTKVDDGETHHSASASTSTSTTSAAQRTGKTSKAPHARAAGTGSRKRSAAPFFESSDDDTSSPSASAPASKLKHPTTASVPARVATTITKPSSASSSSSPSDPATAALHAQICGLLIETMATSRASSLAVSALYKLVMQARPGMKAERGEKEWMKLFETVLESGEVSGGGSGLFGKVESSFKDDADRPLEAKWFYVPEMDEDQERATLIRAMMPRPAKRSETKKYKQYYWRPLGKISKWDAEDDL